MAEASIEWELIGSSSLGKMFRLKVPGGWFVFLNTGSGSGPFFYPDPNHVWDGKGLP